MYREGESSVDCNQRRRYHHTFCNAGDGSELDEEDKKKK